MDSRHGVYTFSTFGRQRKISRTIAEIETAVKDLQGSGKFEGGETSYAFWAEVCKHLGIPGSQYNKRRVKRAYQKKNMATESTNTEEGSSSNVQPSPEISPEADDDTGSSSHQSNTVTTDGDSTPSTSLDSSENPDQYLSHSVPQQTCSFFVSKDDWDMLRKTQLRCSFKTLDWTNVISKGINSMRPFCRISFKRHTVKSKFSVRTGPLFTCSGYCSSKKCPLKVFVKINNKSSLEAIVTFKGDSVCRSCDVLKRRPVRGSDRATMVETLTTKLPRRRYPKNVSKQKKTVVNPSCRDKVPTTEQLKTSSRENIRYAFGFTSLEKMLEEEQGCEDAIIQIAIFQRALHPAAVMLWSKKMLHLFYQRCKDDIVYVDGTESIRLKDKSQSVRFYFYEIVVRHQKKGSSFLPVATCVTSDDSTPLTSFFLDLFASHLTEKYGSKIQTRPVMFICDCSVVLLKSLVSKFYDTSLQQLLNKYYGIVTGQAQMDSLGLPILHHCLSHVMKNAKHLCKKHARKHYRLAMDVFGAMTQATTMNELEEIVLSAAVLFSSPKSGQSVNKHFEKLQLIITQKGLSHFEDPSVADQDYKNGVGTTSFQQHFENLIKLEEGDKDELPNKYFSPKFMRMLNYFFLSQAPLWTGLLLGDLGRHGSGPVYEKLSQKFDRAAQKTTHSYTQANQTQRIMEQSQFDLMAIRSQRRSLTRQDDFVANYKLTMNTLLRDFKDSGEKSDEEEQNEQTEKMEGVSVSWLSEPSVQKKATVNQTPREDIGEELPEHDCVEQQMETSQETFGEDVESQLSSLWEKENTEVVVALIPSLIRGQSLAVHHTDIRSLKPHRWLTGEIIECFLHHMAMRLNLGSSVYILNHYTASLILSGQTEDRKSLSKIDFSKYRAVLSFVNLDASHWKFVYIDAVQSKVYVVDPSKTHNELKESEDAAEKLSDYFKMRHTWVDKSWTGAVMNHPVQQDANSCGVVVIMMARAVLEAFPNVPEMHFDTTVERMEQERKDIATEILHASVFNTQSAYAMCSTTRPPGSGPPSIDWIRCDDCCRWFHTEYIQMSTDPARRAKPTEWKCVLCQ